MIGLDTNVLVRFLVDSADEPSQSTRARALVGAAIARGEPVLIPLVALVETVWVLRRAGGFGRDEIARTIRGLLHARGIEVGDREIVQRAIAVFETNKGDFADHVIADQARTAGASALYTFDRALLGLHRFAEP